MKKASVLGLCLVAAMTATAQTALVKEVERGMKSKIADYPKLVETLKPAFTDAESGETAYPYYVAGKGGYDYFDNQQAMEAMGQPTDKKNMGHAIINSYGYMIEALKRDSVADPKGKIKTKYSKDIIKQIQAHYGDFNNAAVYLWGEQDYEGAYTAWELAFDAPVNPVLGANAPAAYPDSVTNIYAFNQGLAAFNLKDWERTLKSFDRSIQLGNTSKNVYDYAIAAAYNYPDSVRGPLMAKYAKMAYPIYGAEDNAYIGYIINEMIQNGQNDEAKANLMEYIAADPENAQLYFILGVLYENEETPESDVLALEQFEKCTKLDPNNAKAFLQLGFLTARKGDSMLESAESLSNEEYYHFREDKVKPVLLEAAGYLEHSYELDPEEGSGALAILRNIYYNLNDANNLDRVEKLQKGSY